jgi:hypothetical protein
MSDFKITGNPNPVVGKEEFYTISNALNPLFPHATAPKSAFDTPVLWSVHVLEYGRWRKTKENDKTGDKVSYKFLQRSLERNGIRIMATKGDQVARIDIKAQPADKPKIESIELLHKNGKKPSAPLAYGQTLKARVHCLHMEKRKVFVSLWEDDAAGAGHNKANEKNLLDTRDGIVKDGIVDIDFLLKPSFAKIAKMGKDEGKMHEYYITTDFDNEKLASKNVNVKDLETPVEPYKRKTTPPQQPTKPTTSPSGTTNAPKGEITKVHITDTGDHPIKGVFKEKQLKVWINSKGLTGKEIRLRLYEHDNGSPNDLLVDQKFTIKGDIYAIVVSLDKIPRSLGGNFVEEGAEQELFADVEVIQTKTSTISEKVEVDAKVFKQDQGEIVNMVMKVFQPSEEDKKNAKGECFCNKDFEEKDVKKLVKLLKGSETIWEGAALAGGKRVECNISDKSFATLTKSLNSSFKKYNINTCIQKIHFLAQVCEETGTFSLSEETAGQHASSKSIYKGRGLLQLTGVRKENEELYNVPGPYQDYADYVGDQNVVKNPEVVANNAKYCIDSGTWIWSINKKMPNSKSPAVKRWGAETAGKSLNELAIFGDKYLELISVLLNGRNKDKGNMPNGWEKRKSMYNLLKTAFFKYNWYHEDGEKALKTKDVITYHIYENGDIEKHIPKKIEAGYEEKYKYIYHDKKDNEHAICIVDKHETDEKKNGTKPGSKPIHSEIVSDQNISEGQTTRRIKYKNGDIAEYGSNDGSSFWVLYEVTGKKVELVKMPDSLNYSESGVLIKYDFTNTKRRYSGPEYLAVFIGVLAKCGFDDVQTTGSCFSEASCFPSVEHVNGKSIDTIYLDDEREQKLINAFNDYGITKQLRGKKKKEFEHTSDGGKLHNSHLHSGIISAGKIKIIKE